MNLQPLNVAMIVLQRTIVFCPSEIHDQTRAKKSTVDNADFVCISLTSRLSGLHLRRNE